MRARGIVQMMISDWRKEPKRSIRSVNNEDDGDEEHRSSRSERLRGLFRFRPDRHSRNWRASPCGARRASGQYRPISVGSFVGLGADGDRSSAVLSGPSRSRGKAIADPAMEATSQRATSGCSGRGGPCLSRRLRTRKPPAGRATGEHHGALESRKPIRPLSRARRNGWRRIASRARSAFRG